MSNSSFESDCKGDIGSFFVGKYLYRNFPMNQ